MFLKICGITRLEDATAAIDAGATAVGFVLWPKSPRFVSTRKVAEIVETLPPSVVTVGVFVNESPEGVALTMRRAGLTTVQLHGDEPASYASALAWPILRSVTLETANEILGVWPTDTMLLMDAADLERRGGTGRAADWTRAADLARRRRLVLAGGLTPANVAEAIVSVNPFGVDVSSGVEDAPGLKNPQKVERFLSAARAAMRRLRCN